MLAHIAVLVSGCLQEDKSVLRGAMNRVASVEFHNLLAPRMIRDYLHGLTGIWDGDVLKNCPDDAEWLRREQITETRFALASGSFRQVTHREAGDNFFHFLIAKILMVAGSGFTREKCVFGWKNFRG